jgi:hypothetical protein
VTLRSHVQRLIEGAAIVLVPSMLAYTVGRHGAEHATGTLIVLAEPILLCFGLYAIAAVSIHRQWLLGASIAVAMGVGATSLHLPAEARRMRVTVPGWLRALRGCASLPQPIRTPVRVVTWTVEPHEDLSEAVSSLSDQSPDLVILLGTSDPAQAAPLAEKLGGEMKIIEGNPGLTAIVRGNFQYCGGAQDSWTVDLPGGAQLALTFPLVKGAGAIPVMIVQLADPSGPIGLGDWSHELVQGVEHIARAVQLVGARRMLVVGNFQAPNGVQVMAQPLRATGLRAVQTPPNWPARLGGFPFLPVHALDQVWAGPAWHAQRARSLQGAGQKRHPLLVDFTPVEMHAG